MKSLFINEPYMEYSENYSDLQVCQSAAGYYIGSVFHDSELGDIPGTRDTSYFKRKRDAENFLRLLELGDKKAISQLRTHP